MKHKKIFFGILSITILGFLFLFLKFSSKPSLPLVPSADTYLMTSKASYAFDTSKGKLTLEKTTDQPVAEFVYYYYPRASFDSRYLVFSKGWNANYANYPTGIVSLDFETGEVKTTPTDHYAYSGTGQTRRYFYTLTVSPGNIELTQFDKHGKEIQSRHIKERLFPSSSFFCDTDGSFYINCSRDNGETLLLEISEKDLSIIAERPIYDTVEEEIYRFSDNIVTNGKVYMPLYDVRDADTKFLKGDNRLLIKDLSTDSVEWLTLPESYPSRPTLKGSYLFIEHSSTSIGRVAFSIVNLETQTAELVDVSELIGEELDISTSFLNSFTLTKTGKLLFTVHNRLILYDIENKELLDQYEVADSQEGYDIILALWSQI